MSSFIADTSIAPLPFWFHLTWLSMRVCITTKLFKFCSCCCEEQKIGLSLFNLHEFMDPFITLSKLCYTVADLGKFKGIQLLLIIFFYF